MDSAELPPSQRPGSAFEGLEDDAPVFGVDDFRMYAMKVTPCTKRFVHDWVTCPLSHPGEKAKRRDPRKNVYTGIACPAMKKAGMCQRAERCPYAHNVFEYWLHPTRYRTQLCNDGVRCRRRVCFFAHTVDELRVPASKPFVAPETLASIDKATGVSPSVGHGQGVQGQGSLTQQQGALMHIMAALQQSTSESMGHQPDLDPIQLGARLLEHILVSGDMPSTPMTRGSVGQSPFSGQSNFSRAQSLESPSRQGLQDIRGFSNGSSLGGGGYNNGTMAGAVCLRSAPSQELETVRELQIGLAALQQTGSSADREAVMEQLQRMLINSPANPQQQSFSGGQSYGASQPGAVEVNSELAAMFSSAGGFQQNQQMAAYVRPSDLRGDSSFMESSLYSPSAPQALSYAPAMSQDYDRTGRLSLQEDMRPPPGSGAYPRRRSLQQMEGWRTRPGVLTPNMAGTGGGLYTQQEQQQLMMNASNGLYANGGSIPSPQDQSIKASRHFYEQGGQWAWSVPELEVLQQGEIGPMSLQNEPFMGGGGGSVGGGYDVSFSGEYPLVHTMPEAGMNNGAMASGGGDMAGQMGSNRIGNLGFGSFCPDSTYDAAAPQFSGAADAGLGDRFSEMHMGGAFRGGRGVRSSMRDANGEGSRGSYDFSRVPGQGRRQSLGGLSCPADLGVPCTVSADSTYLGAAESQMESSQGLPAVASGQN